MKRIVKKIIKWVCITYVAIAALVGTVVMAWPFVVIFYNGVFAPAPLPIYLPNGFLYQIDFDAPYHSYIITDKNKKRVVIADVRDVMWHKDTVYGYRRGLAKEPYYYICTYGKSCSDTQHLNEADFIRLLEERRLPPYDSRKAQTYDQLLSEQSKTDIGKHGG